MLQKHHHSPERDKHPDAALEEKDVLIQDGEQEETKQDVKPGSVRTSRNFLPIIMSWCLVFLCAWLPLSAQIEGDISLSTQYSDNVFQLSEYDLDRFDQEHPNLGYVDTTDDLSLKAQVDLSYPFRHKWYRFEPSITASFDQNVSNTDKWRRDIIARFAVIRYYWDFKVMYGFYPNILVRAYVDEDGTGELEHYGYQRNLYRADLSVKPLEKTTLRAHFRYEELLYNQFFTEFDGDAKTGGIGIRQNFPVFVLEAGYQYRVFDNWENGPLQDDSSYESNIYTASLRLKDMPLNDGKSSSPRWHPSLSLSFEERFFQGLDDWYGGRVDKIYTTSAGLSFRLNKKWNISLDYSHYLRNVDSPNASVRRLKPYSENRLGAEVKYSL